MAWDQMALYIEKLFVLPVVKLYQITRTERTTASTPNQPTIAFDGTYHSISRDENGCEFSDHAIFISSLVKGLKISLSRVL